MSYRTRIDAYIDNNVLFAEQNLLFSGYFGLEDVIERNKYLIIIFFNVTKEENIMKNVEELGISHLPHSSYPYYE